MKRKLVCALCVALAVVLSGGALAAEWTNGRSPAQPYSGVPEIDLGQTMGYIILFPRPKMPASEYCNVLEIYLPREDVETAEGSLHLYKAPTGEDPVEIATISFAEEDAVRVRPLSEEEMQGLMWGSGVCIEILLPVSLSFDENYYVLMDEGCFQAAGGAVHSIPITNPEAWTPVVQGDYGVGGLYYSEMPQEEPEAPDGDGDETEKAEPAQEEAGVVYKRNPQTGDRIDLDIVLGGDAVFAVIYSNTDSVFFDTVEYTESGHATGVVEKDDVQWGVVFLNEYGEVLDALDLGEW